MIRLQSSILVHIFIFLCLSTKNTATESSSNLTANVSTPSSEAFSLATPPPGGAPDSDNTSVAPNSTEATTAKESETPGVLTETSPAPTAQPVVPAEGNPFQFPLSVGFP